MSERFARLELLEGWVQNLKMKKNKYQLFIEQSNYNNKILKTSKLNKVIVEPKINRWTFYIDLTDYIDADLLFTFTKTLKDYFNLPPITEIDIKFNHKSEKSFNKFANNYFKSTLHYLSEEKASFSALQHFEVDFKDTYYEMIIDHESVWVSEYFKEIYEVFNDLGIN